MRMDGKKLAIVLITALLAGTMTAGCQNNSEQKESGEKIEQENGKVSLPKGKKLTEEVAAEFLAANDLEKLCKDNGTVQIEAEYVYPDDAGNLQTGGKDTFTYQSTEKDVAFVDEADNFYSYYDGYKCFYSITDIAGEEDQPTKSYDINYYSDRALEEVGSMGYGMYTGSNFSDDSVYKETNGGYEMYEYYDDGEGGATITAYYADKEKVIHSVETTIYPKSGESYQETTKKMILGEGKEPKLAEVFENGAYTVKVVENAGTETEYVVEFKVPENTNFFGLISEGEALSYDPEGTQLIGEDQYETVLQIKKDETLYLVNL